MSGRPSARAPVYTDESTPPPCPSFRSELILMSRWRDEPSIEMRSRLGADPKPRDGFACRGLGSARAVDVDQPSPTGPHDGINRHADAVGASLWAYDDAGQRTASGRSARASPGADPEASMERRPASMEMRSWLDADPRSWVKDQARTGSPRCWRCSAQLMGKSVRRESPKPRGRTWFTAASTMSGARKASERIMRADRSLMLSR